MHDGTFLEPSTCSVTHDVLYAQTLNCRKEIKGYRTLPNRDPITDWHLSS